MFDANRCHAVVSVVSLLLFRRIVVLVDSDVAEPTLLLFVHQFLRTGGVVNCDLAEPTLVLFVRSIVCFRTQILHGLSSQMLSVSPYNISGGLIVYDVFMELRLLPLVLLSTFL